MEKAKKIYLGDSVYVTEESGMIKLTTENGYEASNTIFLDLQIFELLSQYVSKHAREFI